VTVAPASEGIKDFGVINDLGRPVGRLRPARSGHVATPHDTTGSRHDESMIRTASVVRRVIGLAT